MWDVLIIWCKAVGTIVAIICAFILVPYLIYLFSKLQMLGWLSAIKQQEDKVDVKEKGE